MALHGDREDEGSAGVSVAPLRRGRARQERAQRHRERLETDEAVAELKRKRKRKATEERPEIVQHITLALYVQFTDDCRHAFLGAGRPSHGAHTKLRTNTDTRRHTKHTHTHTHT